MSKKLDGEPMLDMAIVAASAQAVIQDPSRPIDSHSAAVLGLVAQEAMACGACTLTANQLCTLIGTHVMRTVVAGTGTNWLATPNSSENANSAKPREVSRTDSSATSLVSWKDAIREQARALAIDEDASIALIEIWPSAEQVAHDAFPPGHTSGWHYGDAARAAGGDLFRLDGGPPPDVLAIAREKGITAEHAAALGHEYDKFGRCADLHNALIEASDWARKLALATDAGAVDGGVGKILSFGQLLGELDPQIHHTELSYRGAGLLSSMLSNILDSISQFADGCRDTDEIQKISSSTRRAILEKTMREYVLGRRTVDPKGV